MESDGTLRGIKFKSSKLKMFQQKKLSENARKRYGITAVVYYAFLCFKFNISQCWLPKKKKKSRSRKYEKTMFLKTYDSKYIFYTLLMRLINRSSTKMCRAVSRYNHNSLDRTVFRTKSGTIRKSANDPWNFSCTFFVYTSRAKTCPPNRKHAEGRTVLLPTASGAGFIIYCVMYKNAKKKKKIVTFQGYDVYPLARRLSLMCPPRVL